MMQLSRLHTTARATSPARQNSRQCISSTDDPGCPIPAIHRSRFKCRRGSAGRTSCLRGACCVCDGQSDADHVCVSSAMMTCTEEGVESGSCTALISSTANVYIRVAVEEAGVLCAGGALARTTLLGSKYPENHVEQPRTGPNLSQLHIAGKNCLVRTTQNREELHRTDENR